jgi:hypothetical protein
MTKPANIYFFLCWLLLAGCGPTHQPEALDQFHQTQLQAWNKQLTDVIISDIFTPPVASRIYAYCNIAAYEVVAACDETYRSTAFQFTDFQEVPAFEPGQAYYFPLASVVAFSTVAKKLVFAEEKIEAYEQEYLRKVKDIGIDKAIYDRSVAYGRLVGEHVLAWSNEDGYKQRQALPRHVLSVEPGKWQPTPPDYMQGIEPHWNTIRPFLLDSANQFAPPPPTPFDTVPGSKFYQEAMEVYQIAKTIREANDPDDERIAIARFWDCNPNISYTKGHVMFFHQKISPGGHWISIASIGARVLNLDFTRQAETFMATSVALADAFISCWAEKYKSDLVRPVTYIDKYIEPGWEPLLQTPAFPEYTSGHSVISASAATMLTHLLGDHVAFSDSTELEFGLPPRQFKSFFHASNEAAMSRMYGGIHYRPACELGVEQGKKVGQFIVQKLKTKDENPIVLSGSQ